MSAHVDAAARAAAADAALAWSAMAAAGLGAVAAFAGGAAASLPLALAGGVLLGGGLVLILAGRWLEPLVLLAAVLPLPALYATDAVRISSALVVTAVVLTAWLLRAAARGERVAGGRALVPRAPLVALFTAIVLAAVFGADPVTSARELVNWLLALALLVAAAGELADRPAARHALALAIAATAAVAGVLAVLQAGAMLPGRFPLAGSQYYRATLGFGWPNELGMYFAMALPFTVYAAAAARNRVGRVVACCGIVAIAGGLLATFSRASWLAVLIAPLVLLPAGGARLALRVWLGALLFVALADALTGGAVHTRIVATIGDWVVEQRAALMLAGLAMFIAHPLTGVGPGGFALALEQFGPQIGWLWDYLPTAQNGYVQMAAETGVIGLAALVLFLGTILRRLFAAARRTDGDDVPLRRATLWAFATGVLLAFNEWIFAHGIVQLVMLTAGLGLALAARDTTAEVAP